MPGGIIAVQLLEKLLYLFVVFHSFPWSKKKRAR
jgi:hypothetical protein